MEVDSYIQRQLIVACLDDFYPNCALPNFKGGQYGNANNDWKKAVVDTIYKSMRLDLIRPLEGREGYHLLNAEKIKKILIEGDDINGFDASLLWDIIHFAGTPKLKKCLKRLHLDSWDYLNAPLSQDLVEFLNGPS